MRHPDSRPLMEATETGPSPAWHAMDVAAVLDSIGSTPAGLRAEEASRRLAEHGPNVIQREAEESILTLLWRQINNPLIWVLLGSTVLAIALGKVTDGAVVMGVVLMNGVIGFVQEFRAGKAIKSLSLMVPENVTVLRDGVSIVSPASELVPGDIVTLASGDKVPADLRLIAVKRLQTDESTLTGESLPVEKRVSPLQENTFIADRVNMAYGGTIVTHGAGTGAVVATGAQTELGRISSLLSTAQEYATPLTKALGGIARYITIGILGLAAIILVVGVARSLNAGAGLMAALRDTFIFAIALAVGAIPEGLPAIVTIILAVGVQRMARRKAIIRKLPAAETLGSTTVICTDKTGTLTRNEMTVTEIRVGTGAYSVTGVGYVPEGSFRLGQEPVDAIPDDMAGLLRDAVLCNDASLRREKDAWQVAGDPTEGALIVAAQKARLEAGAVRKQYPRLDVVPFESENRFMATVHEIEGKYRTILKGAPEVIFPRCRNGAAGPLTDSDVAAMASRGLRVLAVAYKDSTDKPDSDVVGDGFRLAGLVGMLDPPRPEALDAVARCREAGVTVKMITGDHRDTAYAIAREFGLTSGAGPVTGAELADMDDDTLSETVRQCNVFARVAPEHKLRLVSALQRQAEVVAMTGDGVNDAPALRQANIGIAMGIMGSAVAKESADMVLADDNFASIAAAVEEGRRIFDNLIRSLAFVLPTNLGLAFILMYAVMFLHFDPFTHQLLLPMLPTQILWINLVGNVGLALPLAFEAKEPDLMKRAPRRPDTPVLGAFVIQRTFLVAILMTICSVGLFSWEYRGSLTLAGADPEALSRARTMAVTTVFFFQVFYMLQCRSLRKSLVRVGLFSNPAVFVGIFGVLSLQAVFIYAPSMQAVFGSTNLSLHELALSAAAGTLVLPVIALEKWVRPSFERLFAAKSEV